MWSIRPVPNHKPKQDLAGGPRKEEGVVRRSVGLGKVAKGAVRTARPPDLGPEDVLPPPLGEQTRHGFRHLRSGHTMRYIGNVVLLGAGNPDAEIAPRKTLS